MYCLEKHLKKYNFKDSLQYWVYDHYFSSVSLKNTKEQEGPDEIFKQVLGKEFTHSYYFNTWYLIVDSTQGLDFLSFVKQYFKNPKENHETFFKRTETLIKFLCIKSHSNVGFSVHKYMDINSYIFNALCDLQNQATKLFKYFINKVSYDDLRWLAYAVFLYETKFRLNKKELKVYYENPLNFYKYIEGRLAILQ